MNKQIQNQKLSMLPYAQIVPAGDFLFTAGLIAPDVDKPTPMKEFPVRHQTRGIYGPLSAALPKYGTELRNTVSLLQFFRGRGQTGAYIGERKKFFTDGVPTSTGIGCNDLLTPGHGTSGRRHHRRPVQWQNCQASCRGQRQSWL